MRQVIGWRNRPFNHPPDWRLVLGESLEPLAESAIAQIEERCAAASKPPWEAFIEGRDHWGGDNFIRVGGMDDNEPDMYVSRASGGKLVSAGDADLDFIAHARRDLPRLAAEVRALRETGPVRSSGRIFHARHEPPEDELPAILATPWVVWRGDGIVLAIPALMIYTTGVYLLILYRTRYTQVRDIEEARAAADRLRGLKANGRAVTLLGGEHRGYGFTYRAWAEFSTSEGDALPGDSVSFELEWPEVDRAAHRVEGVRHAAGKAVTLWA
jgi:hypothetical protein